MVLLAVGLDLSFSSSVPLVGELGGGGAGGSGNQAGTANTGGGGGSGAYNGSNATYYPTNGGSGIVILRYAV